MLKPFFLVLLALFGATMFVAGTLAPTNVKAPLEALATRVAAHLPMQSGQFAAGSIAAKSAAARTASGTVGAASAAPTSGVVYAASAPMASLLVPAEPPAKAHYALQAATFASSDAASLFAASLVAQGHKATVVPVSDADHSLIVAIGDFSTPNAARAQQLVLGEELKSVTLPPVILLPAAQ